MRTRRSAWAKRDRAVKAAVLRAVLRPKVMVERGADLAKADALHHEVHKYCFIARSVNFPIAYEASYLEI
jgi:organic hydroperoxide reductase OsmC/OhrA